MPRKRRRRGPATPLADADLAKLLEAQGRAAEEALSAGKRNPGDLAELLEVEGRASAAEFFRQRKSPGAEGPANGRPLPGDGV
jgi:hypothetical protein